MKLFVILSAVAYVASDGTCPAGYTEGGNGYCFQVFNGSYSYSSASEACYSAGGQLAIIPNAFENSFINGLVRKTGGQAWIGLTCDVNGYYCYWPDGSYYNYNNFRGSYCGSGQCVYMDTNGYWCRDSCNATKSFVCSVPDPGVSPCYGYRYDSYSGACYKGYADNLSFQDAESHCQQECGHLTSITYSYTNTFVQNLFCSRCSSAPQNALIGLYNMGQNMYNWTDGTTFTQNSYSNFAYIDQSLGNCVTIALKNATINAGQWLNADCNGQGAYICKRKQGKC